MNRSYLTTISSKARHFEYCTAPMFVMGAHRSGTTALAHALAKHPDFWTSQETFFLANFFGDGRVESVLEKWMNRPSSSWLSAERVTPGEFLEAVGLGINALFTDRSGGRRWIDHTPHYVLFAETLAGLFPGARFIHVLRDGRQVVHSMIHIAATLTPEEQSRMEGKFLPDWATNFRAACEAWKKLAMAGMDFCQKHPDRGLTIRNSEMQGDPVGMMCRILDFLGADYHEDCADFLRKHRINSSFKKSGNPDAARYAPPQPWEVWTNEQRHIFVEVAGQVLCELGLATPEEIAID